MIILLTVPIYNKKQFQLVKRCLTLQLKIFQWKTTCLLQLGSLPLQCPNAWQRRLCKPTTWKPWGHVYVALDPNVRPGTVPPENVTVPSAGWGSSGHSRSDEIYKMLIIYFTVILISSYQVWYMNFHKHHHTSTSSSYSCNLHQMNIFSNIFALKVWPEKKYN